MKNGETGTVKSGDGPTTKIDEPDPPGTIRDANGRLRDAKTKRFVKDPNSKTSTKKVDGEGSSPKKNEVDSGSGKKVDEDGSAPQKKMGDEQDLETTRSKDTLSEKEYELEKNAMEARRPGKKVDMEDNGVKYNEEVELPNGHKWRKRLDGGWCRFSAKTCFPSEQLTEGQKQAKNANLPKDAPDGYEYYHRPGEATPGIRNKAGNNGPKMEFDPETKTFKPVPETPKVDVNGQELKQGARMTSDLPKNAELTTGEFGYKIKTNDDGLITHASTDNLKLSDKPRLAHEADTPGKLNGDHAGHLLGDRFGGSAGLDNIVSQSSTVNLSTFKKIENTWAKALELGSKVEVEIEVKYNGGVRPSEFNVSWSIDGKFDSLNIPNN